MANTATPPPVLKLNTRVQVGAGPGYIRFVGQTGFAAGKWVGVELDEPNGKNDGSVAGKRYFTCEEARGVFVRPSQIRLLLDGDTPDRAESPTPMAPPVKPVARPVSRAAVSRPSSTTVSRAPTPATTTNRPSATGATVSGRTSVASMSAEGRASSPAKLARPTPSAPRLSSRSVSSSSAGSSVAATPFTSNAATSVTSAQAMRPSTSSASAMPPPATPTTARRIPAPSYSARKPPAAPTLNFAPPSGGSSRIQAPGSARMARTISAESRSSVSSALASRRSSMVRSPPLEVPLSPARSFNRQLQDAIEPTNSSEAVLQNPIADDDEVITSTSVIDVPKPDPFSLKTVEPKRPAEATVPKREHDELLAKLRILEARRSEDRDKLREIDQLKTEAEDWAKVKEKTKNKIAELAAEVRELKKQNKDLTADRDDISGKFDDLNDQVEISLLDKEVAEERFEAAESALEQMKERAAELEVEVNVLRQENARLEGEGDAEIARGETGGAKSNLAYIQLEKQNGRLKDALVRLRDLTSATEAESKRKIGDLEKELDLTSDLQAEYDNNLITLERAESQIENLKTQLDDALGAEDMLEQLTERNLNLSEKIEELQAIVEDLEALKELNDELEESHAETERQMQEELDLKDLQIQETRRRADSLEENIADYEGTIGQFRELVHSLQADLEHMRAQQASQQSESQSLTSQSQAMLNLNMKLQSTVLKSQVKTIELELRRLDAQQASEHLAIVKPYLLPAFFDEDSDAVDSLLFFERLGYKADLISTMIDQRHSISESLTTIVPESLIEICQTRAKLAHFASLNKRFSAQLKRCEPSVFLKMGRVYREVLKTEKRVDAFIEALRKEELREGDCGREVDGFIAQAEHLAEVHLQGSVLDLAEREQGYVATLDLDLDTIAAAIGFTKQTLATIGADSEIEKDLGDASLDEVFFKPLQDTIDQARSGKVVVRKLLRRIDDLVSNASALGLEHVQGFETLAFNSSAIASAVAKLAHDVNTYISDIRASKQAFQLTALHSLVKDIAANELGKQTARPLWEICALLAQLTQDVGTTLSIAMASEHVVNLNYDPPWLRRVAELHSNTAANVDAERQVVKLNEDVRELVREMRIKDQSHQEDSVKIELMTKRLESVKKQADALIELEAELGKAKKQEKAYEDAIEALQGDLDAMEQELVEAKANAPSVAAVHERAGEGEPTIFEGNMETSALLEQIEALRGAVRFIRSENAYLKSQSMLSDLETLPSYETSTIPAIPAPTISESTGLPMRARTSLATTIAPGLDEVGSLVHPVDAHAFATRSKALLRDVRLASCSPQLVDLSVPANAPGGGRVVRSRTPRAQMLAEKERWRALGRRVEQLKDLRPRVGRLPVMMTVVV